MGIFKKKKRLEELDDCPDIKKCAFADSGILSSCRDGNYANCLYRSNREPEEEKYKKSEEEK